MKKHSMLILFFVVVATIQLAAQSANRNLSNLLSPTAVNKPLLPKYNDSIDLGSASFNWRNLYLTNGLYFSGVKSLYVTGTNTGVGMSALSSNTSGIDNTAIGFNANYSNTSGSYNTSLGREALSANLLGSSNTAVGRTTLYSNTVGNSNTAIGLESLYSNTEGDANTASGSIALEYNTTGNNNTANGYASLYLNTSGSGNTGTGSGALYSNTSGLQNTALGKNALYSNTTGNENVAIGNYALLHMVSSYNTAIGSIAGDSYAGGGYNTFVGYDADASALGYAYSTALGYGSRITASKQMRFGNSTTSSIGGYVGWSAISDGRFKKNIKENVIGLAFIDKLRPVTYTLDIHAINRKTDVKENAEEVKAIAENEQVIHSGLIAQEVEKVSQETGFVNDIVDKPKNDNDMYGIRYAELVVPLIKAVQELSKQNDDLKERLQKVENLLSTQSLTNSTTIEEANKTASSFITVYPNPVKDILYIQSKGSANFSLSDANGKTVIAKQITGNGSLDVSKLSTGTYFLRNDAGNEVQKIVVGK